LIRYRWISKFSVPSFSAGPGLFCGPRRDERSHELLLTESTR
jgi:hypothetical protein